MKQSNIPNIINEFPELIKALQCCQKNTNYDGMVNIITILVHNYKKMYLQQKHENFIETTPICIPAP